MKGGVYAASVAAVAITLAAAPRAGAGNGWMMEKMADDLKRANEQVLREASLPANGRVELEAAVKTAPGHSPEIRVIRRTPTSACARQLPLEKAETPEYTPTIREARLNVPVVVAKY